MKKNESKLFTEELARRNPDWEKIVAVHNAALAAERDKVKELEEELNEAVKLLKLEDIDAAIAKVTKSIKK